MSALYLCMDNDEMHNSLLYVKYILYVNEVKVEGRDYFLVCFMICVRTTKLF